MILDKLFQLMAEKLASDIFISAGAPINIKIQGVTMPINQQVMEPSMIKRMIYEMMTPEQIGLYQAGLDQLLGVNLDSEDRSARTGHVLAAITALKQICDHPAAYLDDDKGLLEGRSGKLARLEELVDNVFEAGERMLIFTHFAQWGERLSGHLTARTGMPISCAVFVSVG